MPRGPCQNINTASNTTHIGDPASLVVLHVFIWGGR